MLAPRACYEDHAKMGRKAKDFAVVQAGMPNGRTKEVCIGTGSSISAIDATCAKELRLEMEHFRGIGQKYNCAKSLTSLAAQSNSTQASRSTQTTL